jgi:hypothetical protein
VTDDQFEEFVAVYRAYWPDAAPLGPATLVIWRQKVDQVEERALVAALETLFHDGAHFAPALSELVRRAHDLADDTPDWDEAWAEIRAAAAEHGRLADWRELPWSHPVVAEAVGLIGWRDLCDIEAGDTTFAAQARRAFESARRRAQQGQRYAAITGFDLPGLRSRGSFQRVDRSAGAFLPWLKDGRPSKDGTEALERPA